MILLERFTDRKQANDFLREGHKLVQFQVTDGAIYISYEVHGFTKDYDSEDDDVKVVNSYEDDLIQFVDKSNFEEHFYFYKQEGVWYMRSEFSKEWKALFGGQVTSIETDAQMLKRCEKYVR